MLWYTPVSAKLWGNLTRAGDVAESPWVQAVLYWMLAIINWYEMMNEWETGSALMHLLKIFLSADFLVEPRIGHVTLGLLYRRFTY